MSFSKRIDLAARFILRLVNSPLPSNQLQILADFAPLILPADFLAVAFVETPPSIYRLYPLLGNVGAALPQKPLPLETGLAGHVIASQQIVISHTLSETPGYSDDYEGMLAKFDIRSLIATPIIFHEEVMGALLCGSQNEGAYLTEEIQLCKLLADGLAEGLGSARRYQRLADEHSMIEAILRSSQDAVLLINTEGTILMANPAVKEMLGVEEQALIGHPLESLTNEALTHLFKENRLGIIELPIQNERTAQAQLIPVFTSFNERVGWAAILRDITLLKELEQMKTDFVNIVSHDLKNPITSIVLGANLLNVVGPLNDHQSDLRSKILKTANYMNRLVSDLLDLGKIEAGLELKLVKTNLIELVEEGIGPLKVQFESKQQKLTLNCPPQAMVLADQIWLEHVITNLLSNASKYTPDEGHIQITVVTADGESVVPSDPRLPMEGTIFSVEDSGIGIAAKEIPFVFDKFYRTPTAASSSIKGTGLGLAMAKSIIQAHDGYIWVNSKEGEGSTFSFYLPTCK